MTFIRISSLLLIALYAVNGQTLLQQNYDARSYAFTRTNGLSASGNLSASGSGKAIQVVRMPFGLSIGNSVYISGGSGTAEVAAITNLSGAGGSSAGLITVTTANVHTGSWSLQSATAGVQEAMGALPATGGTVHIGDISTVTIRGNLTWATPDTTLLLGGSEVDIANGASITMSASHSAIVGTGRNVIKATSTGGSIVRLVGCSNCELRNLILDRTGTAVAGGNGIEFVSGVSNQFFGSQLTIQNQYVGILASVAMVASQWSDLFVMSNVSNGIDLLGTNDEHFSNLFTYYNGGHGFKIGDGASTTYCIGGVRIANYVTYANVGDGLHIEGAAAHTCTYVYGSNLQLDSDGGYELYAKYAGAITFSSSEIINGKGVYLDNASAVQFSATRINGSSQEGMLITNGSSRITGSSMIIGDFSNGNPSTYYGIRINNSAFDVNFSGLTINAENVGGLVAGGIKVETGTGAPTGVRMIGVHFSNIVSNLAVVDAALTDVVIDAGYTWVTMTPQNSWTAIAALAARLENNGLVVRVKGSLQAGTTTDGTVLFTLPSGMRPTATRAFPVTVLSGAGLPVISSHVVVNTDGTCLMYGFGANTYVRLDGISFSTN